MKSAQSVSDDDVDKLQRSQGISQALLDSVGLCWTLLDSSLCCSQEPFRGLEVTRSTGTSTRTLICIEDCVGALYLALLLTPVASARLQSYLTLIISLNPFTSPKVVHFSSPPSLFK